MQQNPYAAPSVDPTASRTPGQNVPQDWTIGGVLSVAWDTFKAEPLKILGTMILMGVCLYAVILPPLFFTLPPGLLEGRLETPPDPIAIVKAVGFLVPVILILEAFLFVGWFRFTLAAVRRHPLSVGILFSGASRILPIIGAGLLCYLAVILGMIFLIVPGIIIALGFAVTLPLLADTDASVGQALSQSWDMMKGHKMKLFLFILLLSVVSVVLNLITFNLATLVLSPLFSLAFAEIYMCVTGRREPTP